MTSPNDLPLRTTSDQRESSSAIVSVPRELIDLLDRWRPALDEESLSTDAIRRHLRTVRFLGVWLAGQGRAGGVQDVTIEDLRGFISHRVVTTSPGTADKDWRALNAFFGWMEREGIAPNPIPPVEDDEDEVGAGDSPPLLEMLESWELSLNAANLSGETIPTYLRTVRFLNGWLVAQNRPVGIDDVNVKDLRGYMAHRIETTSPGTADKDRRNLSVFFNWLEREEERIAPNPMRRLEKIVVPASAPRLFVDDELRALLGTCDGSSFEERRDTAIIRTFMDNGMRLSGMAGIRYTPGNEKTHDLKLTGKAKVRIRLKGGREIWVPVGRKAVASIDRYVRARKRQKHASSPFLWLPTRDLAHRSGEVRLGKSGIAQMLERRGEAADIGHVTPHDFRRWMATMWEGDPLELMDIGGWESLDMVRHYQRLGRELRAHKAHAQLSPGDRI